MDDVRALDRITDAEWARAEEYERETQAKAAGVTPGQLEVFSAALLEMYERTYHGRRHLSLNDARKESVRLLALLRDTQPDDALSVP